MIDHLHPFMLEIFESPITDIAHVVMEGPAHKLRQTMGLGATFGPRITR